MSNSAEEPQGEVGFRYPRVLNPETDTYEVLRNGRVAKMGKEGVEQVVTLKVNADQLDIVINDGSLNYSA